MFCKVYRVCLFMAGTGRTDDLIGLLHGRDCQLSTRLRGSKGARYIIAAASACTAQSKQLTPHLLLLIASLSTGFKKKAVMAGALASHVACFAAARRRCYGSANAL
jgi:hypothetical protein